MNGLSCGINVPSFRFDTVSLSDSRPEATHRSAEPQDTVVLSGAPRQDEDTPDNYPSYGNL